MASELGPKQKELLKKLELIRGNYETVFDDESVKSLPKAMTAIHDEFDAVLQGLEEGEFVDDDDEDEDE